MARLAPWLGALLLALIGLPSATHAADVRLWPLVDYHHDAAAQETRLHLLGPLFSYEASPERSLLAVRPLFVRQRGPGPHGHAVALLYPLSIARWDEHTSLTRLFGLLTIARQEERAAETPRWERRVNLYPFVFYRSSAAEGASLSVLPFYANLRQFFGYERVRLVLFPAYLHLKEPLIERTWAPFPFVGWTGGAVGRGWRAWPLYGWQDEGDARRFRYALWPFYVREERHADTAQREERLAVPPFFSRIDSPTLRSRSYGVFFTHTVDGKAGTESWGFPWPLWVYERQVETRTRTAIRLLPFFGDRRKGTLHSRFYLWPLYRTRTVDADDYRYARRDFLLVLGRESDERQFSQHHRRTRSTFFPLWRRTAVDGDVSFGTPALIDAILPANDMVRIAYAPLWQLFRRAGRENEPVRWSLLWDLVSSDGRRLRYPVAFDFSEPTP